MSEKEIVQPVREQPISNVNMNEIREKRKRTSKKVSQWYVSGQLTSHHREN